MTKVFSGVRPSGKLHLGNYLGAIKSWIELQDKSDQTIFGIVDYHAITTPYDPKNFKDRVMDTVIDYLAVGIDPKKSLLIRQSRIIQHTDLAWILSTITPISWLDRLPNYREKIDQVEHSSSERAKSYINNTSLLTYPVLMAADILLYKSNLVPVGDDQKQHIDLTNEIGSKFNHLFGETFPNVKAHMAQGARIMSLQDPTRKMSKTPTSSSEQAGDDCIFLSDDPDTVTQKIKRATTDSGNEIKFDEKNKSGISNLLTIYALLSGKSITELEKKYEGKTYVDFKKELAEMVVESLKPIQDRRRKFASDRAEIKSILELSEEKAIAIAAQTMKEIHEKMGF